MSALTLTQRKRAAIIDAARQEFLARGFRDTSMDLIAERADVSKRTVYNHFANKEALFKAVTASLIAEMHLAITTVYDPDQALKKQLTEIAKSEVELITSHAYLAMFRTVLVESFASPGLVQEIMDELPEGQDPLERWIQKATNDGRLLVSDRRIASRHFYSLLKGSFFWPVIAGYAEVPRGRTRNAIINSAVDMFLSYYGRE